MERAAVSWLFATIAAKRGIATADYPRKGFYYVGGLTEGAETIVVFVAFCLWPEAYPAIAAAFATLCGITALTRWWWGWRAFS